MILPSGKEVNVHGRVQVRGAGRLPPARNVVGYHRLATVQVEVALGAVVASYTDMRRIVAFGEVALLHGPPDQGSHGLVGARLQGALAGLVIIQPPTWVKSGPLDSLAVIRRRRCRHRGGRR